MRKDSRSPATTSPAAAAVRAAAAVASTARPTAAPTCWPVVNMAPAMPWSLPCTPVVIATDAAGSDRPMDSEVSSRPGSTPSR